MERGYDIIVWGASGFTGRLVVDYMAEQQTNSNLKWAVAGRNPQKLQQILAGRDIPVLTADSGDEESIRKVLKDGRLRMALIEEFTKQSVPWFVNFTMLLGGFTLTNFFIQSHQV